MRHEIVGQADDWASRITTVYGLRCRWRTVVALPLLSAVASMLEDHKQWSWSGLDEALRNGIHLTRLHTSYDN